MFKPTETRKRVERRYRRQRIAWLKKHAITIVSAIILVVIASACSYIFWYNYMPSDVNAADGQAKVYIEYRVVAGDTLEGICNRYFSKYGYDRPCSFENEVININNLHGRINYLQVGQIIELPRIVRVEVHEPYRVTVLND